VNFAVLISTDMFQDMDMDTDLDIDVDMDMGNLNGHNAKNKSVESVMILEN
jgi:hypothetical protein